MLVAIHSHKPLVEGSAPKPLLNTEFHSVAARSANAFVCTRFPVSEHSGVRESLTPFANMVHPKIGLTPGRCGGKIPPQFFLSATVATVATVF